MKLRKINSGQSLPDYLIEKGFMATFIEQLDKNSSLEIKRKVTHQVARTPYPLKKKEVNFQERPRSMPRLYYKEDTLAGIPWADRATHHLQNAAALHGATLPV